MGRSRQHDMAMRTSQIRSSQLGAAKLFILLLLALWGWPTLASAQGTLSPVGQQVFLDNSGNPLNNAKICTYAAGTSTPLATYSDVTLMTANANPVRTSSAGRPTTGGVYLSPTSYKFVVLTAGTDNTCSTGTTIWSQDNISAVPAANVALDTTGTAGEALSLGNAVFLSDGTGSLTAGRWYQADADNTYRSSTAGTVGVAVAAIASGASGSIRLSGRMTGLSALTVGELYYASATAGALTATPPTNQRFVGQADSTTSLIVAGNPGGVRLPDSDGTHSLVLSVPSDLTADRLFNIKTGDASVTADFSPGTAGNVWRFDGTQWTRSTTVWPNTATTGGILIASSTNTYTNLADVATGQVLISGGVGVIPAYSSTPTFVATNVTGLNATQLTTGTVPCAALPAGAICQMVSATYATETNSSSSTYADTGLTATITPSSASNKVLVMACQNGLGKDTNNTWVLLKLLRAATQIAFTTAAQTNSAGFLYVSGACWNILDAPATTSATTYKTQFASNGNNATVYVNVNSSTSSIVLMEIKQ